MAKNLQVVETIEKAFNMFFEDPWGYIKLYIPLLVIIALMMVSIIFMDPSIMGYSTSADAAEMAILITLLVFIPLAMIVGIFTSAATMLKADAQMKRKKMSAGEALSKGSRKFWKLLGTGIAYNIIVWIGLLALIIPGIYLAVRLLLSVPATVLEKDYGINRSWRITKDRFWVVFDLIFVLAVINFIIALIPFAGLVVILFMMSPVTMISYVLAYRQLN